MAFRIHNSVLRGEIDNREKGIVRGRIWLAGRAEPITLELHGNALPDLAGCLLSFTNPNRPRRDNQISQLAAVQRGRVGDLTASRKVRVFDVPASEAMAMIRRKQNPPSRLANCLYLEWFSEANGRVVIESTDYEVTISPPSWRPTPEEEAQRAREAAEAMEGFIQQLDEAIRSHRQGRKDPEAEWDEYDYERFFREADASANKYGELLDKYGHSEDAHEKIAELMGWDQEPDPAEQESYGLDDWDDDEVSFEDDPFVEDDDLEEDEDDLLEMESEPEPDPEREGIDWIRTDEGDIAHPLQYRCSESAYRFWEIVKDLAPDCEEDPDITKFLGEFDITAAKLAGALQPIAEDDAPPEPAFTVAYLKRALSHLHNALAGLEAVAARRALPGELIAEARRELFDIRQDILRLMDELRGR